MSLPSGRAAVAASLVAAGVVVAGAAVATGGTANAPAVTANELQARRIAMASGGGLSDASLASAFRDMDPAMRALADAHAPAPRGAPAVFTGEEGPLPGGPQFSGRALQDMSQDSARLVNASIPFSTEANPPARPFRLEASADDRKRALQCLAEAVYYEAAFEPADGQRAVAQVVINRLRHPIYPKTICGVVYQGAELATGCQFTFTCDGSLGRAPVEWAWRQALQVAEAALNGRVAKAVGEATHYHADYVVPYWLPTLSKVAKVGAHIFYRWPGGLGAPAAFTGRYAGAEPPTRTQPAAPQLQLASAPAAPVAPPPAPPEPEPVRVQLAAAAAPAPAKPLELATAAPLALETAPVAPAPKPRATWIPGDPTRSRCMGALRCQGF